jgi:hypothetical protein
VPSAASEVQSEQRQPESSETAVNEGENEEESIEEKSGEPFTAPSATPTDAESQSSPTHVLSFPNPPLPYDPDAMWHDVLKSQWVSHVNTQVPTTVGTRTSTRNVKNRIAKENKE